MSIENNRENCLEPDCFRAVLISETKPEKS
jgi:hypothetical protein